VTDETRNGCDGQALELRVALDDPGRSSDPPAYLWARPVLLLSSAPL